MASLYEIDQQIAAVINGGLVFDEETGEVLFDAENLDELQETRANKLEAVALFVKNLDAEAGALKAEEKALADRRKAKEAKAERLRRYVTDSLLTAKQSNFETARVALSFRTSEAVEVLDVAEVPAAYMKQAAPTPDKSAIKKAIKAGEHVPGAQIVTRSNLQVK